MAHRVKIYFSCRWPDTYRIIEHFKIDGCVTVNGMTCNPVEIRDEDWETLQECERRGYIQIRSANCK